MDCSRVDYLWIIVMFYQLFGLSFWRHPFTAEDPLVSMWCNAKFLQICSDEETNCILNGLRYILSTFSTNFHFRVNYSFKTSRTDLIYWYTNDFLPTYIYLDITGCVYKTTQWTF